MLFKLLILLSVQAGAGGVLQLRQGQARRVVVRLRPVHNSGLLPLMMEEVVGVEVGGVVARNKLQRPLDSYQEEDLTTLRDVWGEAVEGMKERLDDQIHELVGRGEKEREMEQALIERKNCIMEELNQAVVPRPPSKVSEVQRLGMERRAPVLFLHTSLLDSRDDLSHTEEFLPTLGDSSFLPRETGGEFHGLPILHQGRAGEVAATAAWDSSIHASTHLNRATADHEQLTMVVKATVRLSEPYPSNLVLRKRVAFNVYKRKSIANFFRRTLAMKVAEVVGQPRPSTVQRVGVTYELVGEVPKVFQRVEERMEDRKEGGGIDEALLEQYTAAITSVETILYMERVKQAETVAWLAQEAERRREEVERPRGAMARTLSVPNIRLSKSSLTLGGSTNQLSGSQQNIARSRRSLNPQALQRSLPPQALQERQDKRRSLPVGGRSARTSNTSAKRGEVATIAEED